MKRPILMFLAHPADIIEARTRVLIGEEERPEFDMLINFDKEAVYDEQSLFQSSDEIIDLYLNDEDEV